MSNVLVIAEIVAGTLRKVTLDTLAFARQTADLTGGQVHVLVLGSGVGDHVQQLATGGFGADLYRISGAGDRDSVLVITDFDPGQDAFRFFDFRESSGFNGQDSFGLVDVIRVFAGDADGDGQFDDSIIRIGDADQNSFAPDVARIDLLNVSATEIADDVDSIFLGAEVVLGENVFILA